MEVTLEDITPDAEQKIATYAAICYDSDTSPEANKRRIKHLMKVNHLSTLRFAHAVIKVSGISRACSHQLVRSKHLEYLQRSQRYVNEAGAEFVIPEMGIDEELIFRHEVERAYQTYDLLVKHGLKKEDARFILPNAATTALNVVGNLQAWKDFITLRNQPKAQWEIREVAQKIQHLLQQQCPNVFGEPHE